MLSSPLVNALADLCLFHFTEFMLLRSWGYTRFFVCRRLTAEHVIGLRAPPRSTAGGRCPAFEVVAREPALLELAVQADREAVCHAWR